jgi:hypothetical protein
VKSCSPRSQRDERGVALILAIVFMLVVGLMAAAVLTFITSNPYDRATLDRARNRQYAADGAIEADIAQVRSNMTTNGTVCPQAPFTQSLESPAVSITVTCVYVEVPTLSGRAQRNVTFSARCTAVHLPECPNSTDAIIRAQVNFESPSPLTATPITVTRTYVQSWTVET